MANTPESPSFCALVAEAAGTSGVGPLVPSGVCVPSAGGLVGSLWEQSGPFSQKQVCVRLAVSLQVPTPYREF